MSVADVLSLLVSGATKLSDALRSATLLPEVRSNPDLLAWLNNELVGYPQSNPNVPEYRVVKVNSVGDATNGAWFHRGVSIPTGHLPERLRGVVSTHKDLVQSVGSLQGLMESKGPSFQIPWPSSAIGFLNNSIANGDTEINRTYGFQTVYWEIPRPFVQEILERVRHRAMTEISALVPVEQLSSNVKQTLASSPLTMAVSGSGNQIIVASPNTNATLTISTGDRGALWEGLASLGITPETLDSLSPILEGPDEPGRLTRVLAWCRGAAEGVGINTVASAAATLILQYLGLV